MDHGNIFFGFYVGLANFNNFGGQFDRHLLITVWSHVVSSNYIDVSICMNTWDFLESNQNWHEYMILWVECNYCGKWNKNRVITFIDYIYIMIEDMLVKFTIWIYLKTKTWCNPVTMSCSILIISPYCFAWVFRPKYVSAVLCCENKHSIIQNKI